MPVHLTSRYDLRNRDHRLGQAQVRVCLVREFLGWPYEVSISRALSPEQDELTFALDGARERRRLEVDLPVVKAKLAFAPSSLAEEGAEDEVG